MLNFKCIFNNNLWILFLFILIAETINLISFCFRRFFCRSFVLCLCCQMCAFMRFYRRSSRFSLFEDFDCDLSANVWSGCIQRALVFPSKNNALASWLSWLRYAPCTVCINSSSPYRWNAYGPTYHNGHEIVVENNNNNKISSHAHISRENPFDNLYVCFYDSQYTYRQLCMYITYELANELDLNNWFDISLVFIYFFSFVFRFASFPFSFALLVWMFISYPCRLQMVNVLGAFKSASSWLQSAKSMGTAQCQRIEAIVVSALRT